jgi:hypothetical protein
MNWERLSNTLRKIERLLGECERGDTDCHALTHPLWHLAGEFDFRPPGEVAGRQCCEWCEIAYSLKDGIAFAAQTGKPVAFELRRCRRLLAPLFEAARQWAEVCV